MPAPSNSSVAGEAHCATVLLGDADAAWRERVCGWLSDHGDLRVCAESTDAAGAVAAALEQRPDLCLLDVALPGNGVVAAYEILTRIPTTRVVMLTNLDDDADLFPALRAGVSGYLGKDISPQRLPVALLEVLDGAVAIPQALVARMLEAMRERAPLRRDVEMPGQDVALTPREWQILDLLRHEPTTAQIADKLSVEQTTIRDHLSSLVRKLDVKDRDEARRLLAEPPGHDE